MELLLSFTFLTALLFLANVLAASQSKLTRQAFFVGLFAVHILILLAGLSIVLAPEDQLGDIEIQAGVVLRDVRLFGRTLILMAAWGMVASLARVRRMLVRWLPIDADSPVHGLSIVLSGYLVGGTALTLAQGGLEELAMSAASASIIDILGQFAVFSVMAFVGVGLYTRRDASAVRKRLGLERPTRNELIRGVRWIAALVLLQWFFGAIGTLIDPGQVELLDQISGSLLEEIDTVWEWLLLALATGMGEELLFRGAMQPVLGLKTTAFLFAIAHVQYGITPVTFAVLIIGIVFGYIRRQSNTTVTIFIHAGYNFVLGLLTLLATYLQPPTG